MAPRASGMARKGVRLVAPCGVPFVVCSPSAARLVSVIGMIVGMPSVDRLEDSRQEPDPGAPNPRGVLYPARLPTFDRLPAPDAVAQLGRWFWIPEWRIPPGRASRQHLIAFPPRHPVLEPGSRGPAGPTTGGSYPGPTRPAGAPRPP